jgi:hypothetical protein
MPLVTVVITLGVVGLLLWLVNRFIPMQGQIKGILNAVPVNARQAYNATWQSSAQRNSMRSMLLFVIGSAFSLSAFAQANAQTTVVVESAGSVSPYHAVVISRTVQAVDYLHRGGATEVNLAGTTLDVLRRRQGQGAQQARHHGSRSGIRQPATSHNFRQRVSYLCPVGDLTRRAS